MTMPNRSIYQPISPARKSCSMKDILQYESAHLVSSDYIGSTYSCIFDSNYTKVINGNLVKVFGWYDNEWGYSTRLVDLVERLTQYV